MYVWYVLYVTAEHKDETQAINTLLFNFLMGMKFSCVVKIMRMNGFIAYGARKILIKENCCVSRRKSFETIRHNSRV